MRGCAERFRKIISTKMSKTAFREILDPQNISAIRYDLPHMMYGEKNVPVQQPADQLYTHTHLRVHPLLRIVQLLKGWQLPGSGVASLSAVVVPSLVNKTVFHEHTCASCTHKNSLVHETR